MKKIMSLVLIFAMLLCLTACGDDAPTGENLEITRGTSPVKDTEAPAQGGSTLQDTAFQPFQVDGVKLVPGEPFQADALGEPESVYQAPSCAIEGSDNVYNYGSFELTAFDDGSGETIYSIYFVDPALATPEGLCLGDDAAKAQELYGENYREDGTARVYVNGDSQLFLIVENETVISIEYRLSITQK